MIYMKLKVFKNIKSSQIDVIFYRREHNVAILQLKSSLQFSSTYLPICLPQLCDRTTCRTWGGQTEEQILGTDAYFFKIQDQRKGTIQNLYIVNNTECKKELNWDSSRRTVKRLIQGHSSSYF